jgi:hypothetical protein
MRPGDTAAEAIVALAWEVRNLQGRAAQLYRPVVEEILRTGSRNAADIERTLDGLLDFGGHESVLAMYRQLCRHYWAIDPTATADYVRAYRERWGSEEDGGEG